MFRFLLLLLAGFISACTLLTAPVTRMETTAAPSSAAVFPSAAPAQGMIATDDPPPTAEKPSPLLRLAGKVPHKPSTNRCDAGTNTVYQTPTGQEYIICTRSQGQIPDLVIPQTGEVRQILPLGPAILSFEDGETVIARHDRTFAFGREIDALEYEGAVLRLIADENGNPTWLSNDGLGLDLLDGSHLEYLYIGDSIYDLNVIGGIMILTPHP